MIHGGDYNPDQWIETKEIWDEDMRLMKLAHINSASIGIFSWSITEPEEGVYNFEWLDEIMDKLHDNGVSVMLATPSGARPAWLAQKYPEVLRVAENGIRNEFGVRHNHCPTSPIYREKVQNINRKLAERYKDHPALKVWHISNEYGGECHCELCREAFREWLKNYYHNDLDELNRSWWNGFWSHKITDWSQISSPKERGEKLVTGLKLAWNRFVTDSHISFFENEIVPLREITPDIPVTTNFMRMYEGIDYQKFAKHLDFVSWDNYPYWERGFNRYISTETAFVHDVFRSMKNGQPFFMMESSPSNVNWHDVNKLPRAET
ncbi:MAG: beta-galactosidase, partial [Clostridia bacterium]|nr:beta-galactosidase [Clostridia bacterium]